MLSGCEKVLCQLFNSGFTSAKALRWHMFKKLKGHLGVEKLLPTQGCIIEHLLDFEWADQRNYLCCMSHTALLPL